MKNLMNKLRNVRKGRDDEDSFELTTHRTTEKRMYKEHCGVSCSYCCYHRGENSRDKYYTVKRRPSWKLVSKKRKQWMPKPKSYQIVEIVINARVYTELTF